MQHRTALVPALALVLGASLTACGGRSSGPTVTPGPLDPQTLPLLPVQQCVGITSTQSEDPATQARADAAFDDSLAAGAELYALLLSWEFLEPQPGVYDTATLDLLLGTLQTAGLAPLLVLGTVDTNQLPIPPEFVDPSDASSFASSFGFDHPDVRARFRALLDVVVPRLVANGGFYLSVGNEADIWLDAHPTELAALAGFVEDARAHAHSLAPGLAVGVTVTHHMPDSDALGFAALRDASDMPAFTYYPVGPGFAVEPPGVVAGDLAGLALAVQPAPLLVQEAGFPAGDASGPSALGSSLEQQRQFVENVFVELGLNPNLRALSFHHEFDWSAALLDEFEAYYGSSDPAFREFLGTLGLMDDQAFAKPAWSEYLQGLEGV